MKVLSRFSKGIRQAKALSFGLSAHTLCDVSCKLYNKGCYAERPEAMYKNYYNKLIRHRRTLPENLVRLARQEIDGLKWFRFSVSGSLPKKSAVKNWKAFASELQGLCSELLSNDCKVHLPVESMDKARSYRAILPNIVVRRTIQTERGLSSFNDSAAYVVGETPGKHNLELSRELAQKKREEGKSVVVCPAVFKNKFGEKSKCGKCTACASPLVDLILYPLH